MKITVYLYKSVKTTDANAPRQVCVRVRDGKNDLRCRTELLALPKYWDGSVPGYRNTKFLGKGEITAMNKRISDITAAIYNMYKPQCDGTWLRNTINAVLHPKAIDEPEVHDLPTSKTKDTTLETLDAGSLCEWMVRFTVRHRMAQGRVCCYRSTIKKYYCPLKLFTP